MLNEELDDKERQYSELEEEWKAEKASLSGTQTIKAELEQAKIAIEQARRVGDLARMSELAVRQNSGAGKTAGKPRPSRKVKPCVCYVTK
ncbi:protein disaggregation chaperone [Salmonella enterica subsp. enterica]|nr:protein disaggregation chaperone [Salmonella enterica subsp. enterica]